MENEEVKQSGVPGSVSKCEDAGVGPTSDVDKKTTGDVAGDLTVEKHLPVRPVDEELENDLEEKNESVSEPKWEAQSSSSEDDESADIITGLEANLTKVRNFLFEMKERTEKTKSELSAQIADLQNQRDSLLCELEQTTKEVNDSKSIVATLQAQIAALDSELNSTKDKSEKTRSRVVNEKHQVVSETKIDRLDQELQSDKEKQIEMTETVEKNQEISKTISSPESVDITETEQVELPQQQEVEPSIETMAIQPDKQKKENTVVESFAPTAAETEASVVLDVTLEEAKAADFPTLTDKIIFIRALSDIQSQDEATRINAVKTLGGIRHEFSVRVLVAQMIIETEPQVRTECIKAMAELNMKEALPVIERSLTEKTVSVRLAAVRALYRVAGSEGARLLVRMLSDEDADVRRRTTTCISWLGQKDLAVELVPLLNDISISVRRAAVEAMSNLRSRQVIPGLIRHLNDPDKTIRRAINAALETITGKKMSKTLPKNEKSFQYLVARWQQWLKDEYTVLL